jgi:hypothetical protein
VVIRGVKTQRTIALMPNKGNCDATDHSAGFKGTVGIDALEQTFGPPPYTLDVEIMIDSTRYRATAVWPRDYDKKLDVTPLIFSPPLPHIRTP